MSRHSFHTSLLLVISMGLGLMPTISFTGSLSEGIWPEQTIVFHLGDLNGSEGRWRLSFSEAVDRWNDVWVDKRIETTTTSFGSATCAGTNFPNRAYFLSHMCGAAWGDAISVTPRVITGNTVVHADIVFNSNVLWSTYDGNRIPGVNDLRRIAVHELGHALGLNHEDAVPSIMAATVANTFLPQFDDINTLAGRYGTRTNNLTLKITGDGSVLVAPKIAGTSVLIEGIAYSSDYGEVLDCTQPECNYTLQDGLRLTVSAIPAEGQTFVRFEGTTLSGSIIGLAPLFGDRTLTAIFADADPVDNGNGSLQEIFAPLPFDSGDYVLSRVAEGVLVYDKKGPHPLGIVNTSIYSTLTFRDSIVNLSDIGYWGQFTPPTERLVSDIDISQQVYRFYNTRDKAFFYTASAAERDMVIERSDVNRNNIDEWPYAYQGSTFAAAISYNGAVPLYRFYNTRTGHHFYTASEAEVAFVNQQIAGAGWPFVPEGVAFQVYQSDPLPDAVEFEIPVYRLYSPGLDRHFYTGSEQERDQMLASGNWNDEGIGFWAEWYANPEL